MELTALSPIAGLALTDGNFIVGDGTKWVAESGATARTSLGLGTGDSPEFTATRLLDTAGGTYYTAFGIIGPLTADRVLGFTIGDANRTVTLTGNPTLADWFDQSVKTTAAPGFATGVTIGNLTLANGSITDSGGAISFGDENLSTSGTLGAGVITGTGLVVDTPTLVVNASGYADKVGIGTASPQYQLHVSDGVNVGTGWRQGSTVGIVAAGTDAYLESVSTDLGTWGGAITLKQVDGTVYENGWALIRQTNGDGSGDGSLRFTYGTSANPALNTALLILDTSGELLVTNKIAFTQTDGNEYIDSLADGYMDYGATTTHRFNANTEITGTLEVNAKTKLTSIGGFAIKLTNKTGANTVQGQTVKANTATDDGVILTAADDDECIGVFLDSGIAADAEAWVIVAGIADVAMGDNEAATHGNWVETNSTEAGYADATAASPAAAPQHFNEIGHCIESVAAGGGGTHILARCVLHFN